LHTNAHATTLILTNK